MGYAYKVVELREKLMGGKMSGERLESVLNEHAAQGWQPCSKDWPSRSQPTYAPAARSRPTGPSPARRLGGSPSSASVSS